MTEKDLRPFENRRSVNPVIASLRRKKALILRVVLGLPDLSLIVFICYKILFNLFFNSRILFDK
jgi:hypothetical protein